MEKNLEKEYYIQGIELLFESKAERVYQYQVYALPDQPVDWNEDFFGKAVLLIDGAENTTYENGHYSFETDGINARYVIVKVLGNSLYPENKYAAAGLYDLRVFGCSNE